MIPYDFKAYQLLHEGALALAEVEAAGVCIDTDYVQRAIRRLTNRIERLDNEMAATKAGQLWAKEFGATRNWNSRPQLCRILFDRLGYERVAIDDGKETDEERTSTDKNALAGIDDPFVKLYLEYVKIQKTLSTNFKGILREVVDGKVHCFFNLHTARTFRSSSDNFNYQNIPVRDAETAQLVRRAFGARPGRQLVEIDIQGAEVRVAACYHKDPVMVDYILDPTKDMHRDMAVELFKLPVAEVSKEVRHRAKNLFVFPQFYGDWWPHCAKNLWGEAAKVRTVSGVLLQNHLRAKGMKTLGSLEPDSVEPRTFADHVRLVEKGFWGERFKVYTQWKQRWYEQYSRRGWFKSLTGFVCQGFMRKNEVINYPVQGSAFHCLLWGLTQLVRHELPRRRMNTIIVGQIHDSIVADVPPEELDDFLGLAQLVFSRMLSKHWPWLIVPIKIEAEVSPVGGSWADKKPYEIKE